MSDDVINVTVDGKDIQVPNGITVLQACEIAGVEIPRFCYHERLSIAGNCRMCLVGTGGPKPTASCAVNVMPDMQIDTQSEEIKQAREGVMEFLLINHPLDCPICDQGGECDLQDQALGYGEHQSRFDDNKRAVGEKYMGPLIKTVMTRCIHCTRCVRFANEVAGTPEIGAIGRGEMMEITTLEQSIGSELSGNVIDLCPVGALTSRPFAFTARPWELDKTETIDVMDAVGSNIRLDSRGREIMRIMPRNHDDVNQEWLGDKSRFVWDGLNRQRLDRPYIRKNGNLTACDWQKALAAAAKAIKGKADKVAAIAGDLACAESQKALKDIMAMIGSPHLDCRQDGAKISGGRGNYIFNSTIAGIDEADAILLIGGNPRKEAPVLNARIRARWLTHPLPIALIGEGYELTYDYQHLGTGAAALADCAFAETLKAAKNPLIIIGAGALIGADGEAVLAAAINLATQTGATFNMLHHAAGRVAGLDLGLLPGKNGRDVEGILQGAKAGDIETIILLGADEIDMSALDESFVIYIGSHGDRGAHHADLILPAAAYSEKQAIYVNTEGRPQMTARAVFPPYEAKEDWKIFRALSDLLGEPLPYDNIEALRAQMFADAPQLAQLDECVAAEAPIAPPAGALTSECFTSLVTDYYMTNPIARASEVMAACAKAATKDNAQDNLKMAGE